MSEMPTDQERLDWLEKMADQKGGLLLHDGSESGRLGLGLRPGTLVRSLRQAIDDAMGYDRTDQEKLRDLGKI